LTLPHRRPEDIRAYLLQGIDDNPRGIVIETAKHFAVTRQAVLRHVRNLLAEGKIAVQGRTRDRRYTVVPIAQVEIPLVISPDLEEHVVWRQSIRPALEGVRDNVLGICQYGFTEMLKNAIDHSESPTAIVTLDYSPHRIRIRVADFGVGIFNKIQKAFNLPDPRDAILELAKGKLTTDPKRHSGEGIFFASRMFDRFSILSGKLYFAHKEQGDDWLLEDEAQSAGTLVSMVISPSSERTTQEIFDRFASSDDDFGFSKTHVPVVLARYGDENLVSRSQAKRLLTRFERFREIILDFKDISTIGQAFADEVFRVFPQDHPQVHLYPINATSQIARMIGRALAASASEPKEPTGSA
jgi:anti-sigma regulatory factor (Ser/Thr protein kinase)